MDKAFRKLMPFGRHLHRQIVGPLIIGIVLTGVIASTVAVSLISRITDSWVDQAATRTSDAVVARLEHEMTDMVTEARLTVDNAAFVAQALEHNEAGVLEQLIQLNTSLNADNLMLLDDHGVVIASTGRLLFDPGEAALGQDDLIHLSHHETDPVPMVLGGRQTLSAMQALAGPDGTSFTLVLSSIIDEDLVYRLAEGSEAGIAIYDEHGELVALSAPEELGGTKLRETLEERSTELNVAVDKARTMGESQAKPFTAGGHNLRGTARRVTFADEAANSALYIATLVSTDVTDSARVSTTHLILTFSAVAVIMLMGLGWWVGNTVTAPLVVLANNASHVAEGEFDAKVEVGGSNEVRDLAESFNRMTDSLKERSTSLTKKVLELSTLYEMSRLLGSTLELDRLLESVLESACMIFDVEIGYIAMIDRETGALEIRVWQGTDLSNADEGVIRNSMSEWVVREGRPLIFNPQLDAEGEERRDGLSDAIAALCVPLPSPDGVIGSLTIGSSDRRRRFNSDDVRLLATIANHATIAVGNISLFSSVQEAYLATVRALAAAVDAKDPYTRGHSEGVAAYALTIGQALGFSPEQMVALEMAAYLHDIGKIGISEEILLKPGKLTETEMSQMRHHPLIGANILKPVAFPWPIAPIVRHHHEHFDGEGYPAGLRTEEIPILARVLTVADSFEAMVADRPYRRGRSQQEAILELRRCAGTQFDPRVVEAFIGVLETAAPDLEGTIEDTGEIGADEAQAVYIAIGEGMFSGFRRLGGPRLAHNLECVVNERLREREIPLALQGGRLVATDGELGDEAFSANLSQALDIMAESIERASGAGLADHFLAEALETLPDRMRGHAERLGFSASA